MVPNPKKHFSSIEFFARDIWRLGMFIMSRDRLERQAVSTLLSSERILSTKLVSPKSKKILGQWEESLRKLPEEQKRSVNVIYNMGSHSCGYYSGFLPWGQVCATHSRIRASVDEIWRFLIFKWFAVTLFKEHPYSNPSSNLEGMVSIEIRWISCCCNAFLSQWDLVCERQYVPTIITTCLMAGVALGAAVMGQLADTYGRRHVFIIGGTLAMLGEAAQALAPTWQVFALVRFFTGFFAGK